MKMYNFPATLIVTLLVFLLSCSTTDTSMNNPDANIVPKNKDRDVIIANGWDPQNACNLLSHIDGLQTRGYKNKYEDSYGCSSPYKDIGINSPLANNIAYYVNGNGEIANELKLVLNVNAVQNSKEAHNELILYGRELIQNSLKSTMSKEMTTAISSGKNGKWKLKNSDIELSKEKWANGKGYEMKFTIKK